MRRASPNIHGISHITVEVESRPGDHFIEPSSLRRSISGSISEITGEPSAGPEFLVGDFQG
jgi:hypothetical protein